jgi:hypothetical protein
MPIPWNDGIMKYWGKFGEAKLHGVEKYNTQSYAISL